MAEVTAQEQSTLPDLPGICAALGSGLLAAFGHEVASWILAATLGSLCKSTCVDLEMVIRLMRDAHAKTEGP